jgi:hypothetical protein
MIFIRTAAICSLAVLATSALNALAQNANIAATQKMQTVAEESRLTVEIPVRRVVLFTSGLGYFEHEGAIEGNVKTELAFRGDQINDVLKSLVAQDTGGAISGVRYSSQLPLAETLKSFQVDVSANPAIADLLNQTRGAEIRANLPGNESVTGRIIGVEERVGEKTKVSTLNILTARGSISSIAVANLVTFEYTDPKLQKELNLALETLMKRRDGNRKPVTVLFDAKDGKAKRDVRVAYTVEAPVWKMSYRLILPEAGSKDKAKFQGWVIVENATESDWTDVKLSMVSGRPLSFIENLYASYYIPRPVVQPRPLITTGGESDSAADLQKLKDRFDAYRLSIAGGGGDATGGGALFGSENNNNGLNNGLPTRQDPRPQAIKPGTPAVIPATPDEVNIVNNGGVLGGAVVVIGAPNWAQGVSAMGEVEKMGDNFRFELGKVTIPRQQAAMLPIVTADSEVERVSIYNPRILATHAMLGVKFINGADTHILAGPVTVMESSKIGSAYAGDAKLLQTAPNQKRWLSYAVDQEVKVSADDNSENKITGMKIAKGQILIDTRITTKRTYKIDNRSKEPRDLIIELPLSDLGPLFNQPGVEKAAALISPKTEESTELYHRFRTKADASKESTFEVTWAETSPAVVTINRENRPGLLQYIAGEQTPKAVRDVLTRVNDAWEKGDEISRTISQQGGERRAIADDQTRIRQNLQAVEKNTTYYNQQLKALQDSDEKLHKLDEQLKKLTAELEANSAAATQLITDSKVD